MSLREYLLEEYKGYTSKDGGSMGEHNHPYEVDNFGNGETSPDNTKHAHKINEFNVQPGGEDGHGHMIDNPMQEQRVDAKDLHNAVLTLKKITNRIDDIAADVRALRKVTKAFRGKELKALEDELRKSLNMADVLVKQFGAK